MTIAADSPSPELHRAHRDVTGGRLRPATFGVMDGLVSNFALIAGVVGGGARGHAVILTGLAGLAAGACSMASGEFISVTSQTELMRAEIAVEKQELDRNPNDELRELIAIFQAKGLEPDLAAQVARELSSDPEVAWRVHVREELGVNPDDLPSSWVAASSSFVAFAFGALIPLIPFMIGATSLVASIALSGAALSVVGGIVARMTARPLSLGASRQLIFGAMTAAITFGVGMLFAAIGP